jgi:hypothetical protein
MKVCLQALLDLCDFGVLGLCDSCWCASCLAEDAYVLIGVGGREKKSIDCGVEGLV